VSQSLEMSFKTELRSRRRRSGIAGLQWKPTLALFGSQES
jgi:hypothetical protein